MHLDEKDRILLTHLQKDCRASLTTLSKLINMSVDSTKKRLIKLQQEKIFHPQLQLRPRNFGYENIVDIKIKLRDYTKEDYDKLPEEFQSNAHFFYDRRIVDIDDQIPKHE